MIGRRLSHPTPRGVSRSCDRSSRAGFLPDEIEQSLIAVEHVVDDDGRGGFLMVHGVEGQYVIHPKIITAVGADPNPENVMVVDGLAAVNRIETWFQCVRSGVGYTTTRARQRARGPNTSPPDAPKTPATRTPAPACRRAVRSARGDWEACIANLEAALQAGRNVTFRLQKELSSRPGFRDWYEPMQAKDEGRSADAFLQ